jgi:exodeoxyribonuclease-1
MSTTLYWHDYETFGQNARWSGIAQFAGIRTDLDLKEVGEPLMVYCQPPRDSWPDPVACLITGITPQHCRTHGLPEPEFARQLMRELGRPGTCGVGYNSIRFDDEFTRHMLYRNFYDPYEREWKSGNSRWDVLDVLRMARALRPEGIVWPYDDQGLPVMRLEQLTAANGIAHAGAHDALVDVRATIAMARLLKRAQPRLYDYAFTLRDKKTVLKLFDWSSLKPMLHVSSRFGSQRLATALVMPLMQHPTNRNEIIVYDLMQDPSTWVDLPADEIRRRLFTAKADMEEGVERIAIKSVHINRSPMLASLNLLTPDVEARTGIDRSRCEQHWQSLLPLVKALQARLAPVFNRTFDQGIQDAEFQLYSGLLPDGDRHTCKAVREASEDALTSQTFLFEDSRLQALLFRYRARHFPQTLSSDEQAQWAEWRQYRLNNVISPDWITREAYLSKIAVLQAERSDPADQQVLAALANWVTEIDA